MKIKVIIIEDEEPAGKLILKYLEDKPEIEIAAVCTDGFAGLKACAEHKPDLIFLDIQMPKLNGFELLEVLEPLPSVIFTTAFDQFAVKAFEANAVDYLLKPFGKNRFNEALEKAVLKIKTKSTYNYEEIKKLTESRQELTEKLDRIVVKTGTSINIIQAEEIVRLESDGDYVRIFTETGKYLKENTLKFYENKLDNKLFVRIHRSAIININYLEKIELFEKESYLVHLKNGEKVKAGVSGYKLLKEILGF